MVTVTLDQRALGLALVAGAIIQSAVSLKNSAGQYKGIPLHGLSGLPAKAAFALGWALLAYSICGRDLRSRKCILAVAGSAMVVAAVFHIKKSMAAGKAPNSLIKMMFPIGWAIVAYSIYHRGGALKKLGAAGAAMVLLSMMVVLPYQRKHGIIDGPGMNLFALAWVLIALGISVKTLA